MDALCCASAERVKEKESQRGEDGIEKVEGQKGGRVSPKRTVTFGTVASA